MVRIVPLVVLLVLSGCATHAWIHELREDQVRVRVRGNNANVVRAEAQRGCRMHGRTAEPVQVLCVDSYCVTQEVIFACVE